jgi:uncharacterized tellurite resistance protein B-like protein
MGEFFLVIAVIVVLALVIYGFTLSDDSPTLGTHGSSAHNLNDIRVKCTFKDISNSSDTKKLSVARVTVSADVMVPQNNQPVEWVVTVVDVTDGEDSPQPVICEASEYADENTCFEFRQDAIVPYRVSHVTDMPIAEIPLFALRGPKRGRRSLKVIVSLVDMQNRSRCFASGSCIIKHTQNTVGYSDWKEHTHKQEACIATLALAMAAADGRVSKRETTIINKFFSDRYSRIRDSTERKKRTTKTLHDALSQLKDGSNSKQLIDEYCSSINSENDIDTIHEAYSLCAKVASADEKLDPREESALSYIARKLTINEDFVKEIHDYEFSVMHYRHRPTTTDEQVLQMPPDLSVNDKLSWLEKEYLNWQERQSHGNPEIAKEANDRIEVIMNLITKLEGDRDG